MKTLKRISIFALVLAIILSLSVTAFAVGSVTYQESASKFIFAPGSDESPTDLFANFKNVMPGDNLTEQIVIKNDKANKVKIKVYLRSKGAQNGTDYFLEVLDLTVEAKENVLFDAPADETAGLTDWTYLGTVYSGGEITLDLTLSADIKKMTNDYADKIGYIDWEFKIEELPVEPSDPSPSTGDTMNIILWGGLMIASCAAIFFLILAKRRKENA